MSDSSQYRGLNSPHETRHLVIPRAEPNAKLTPLKYLGAQASSSEGEDSEIVDPLIQGLLDRLPKRNGVWTLDDRAKWLRTAASIFGLVYKANDGDHGEISVVLVKQANSPVTASGSAEAISPGFIGQNLSFGSKAGTK
jgi:hypothetical protein